MKHLAWMPLVIALLSTQGASANCGEFARQSTLTYLGEFGYGEDAQIRLGNVIGNYGCTVIEKDSGCTWGTSAFVYLPTRMLYVSLEVQTLEVGDDVETCELRAIRVTSEEDMGN